MNGPPKRPEKHYKPKRADEVDGCPRCEARLVTVDDVQNAIKEHMAALDHAWPEYERYSCNRAGIIEILDGIKLRLIERADRNSKKHLSAFQRAARKITGYDPEKDEDLEVPEVPEPPSTSNQRAELKSRISRNTSRNLFS